ncbi:MAG: YitT family protein [Lachnospiraceae bacterium]|nr:YitT family protein [Lachnospiraceae bacterium]
MSGVTAEVKKRFNHERRIDLLWICLGTFFMAAATNLFFTPMNLVPGGFTGLAIMIKYVTGRYWPQIFGSGLPTWVSNVILNVPLILLTIKSRGFRFIRRTLGTSLLFSLWLALIPEYGITEGDLFLAASVGGAIMGAGLGWVLLGKTTTGGTDTLAALIQKAMPHLSVAKILPILDGAIILLAVWIFGVKVSLYALVSVFISGLISNNVVTGAKTSSVAYIVSDDYEEIGRQIMEEIDRGATLLAGKGMYSDTNKPVIFVAVSNKEQVILKEVVHDIDPSAFMIITDAREIRGEGFLKFSKDEL